jgi:predicted nuclease of predicted toxin-antitoxin system
MKFLLDENFPKAATAILTASGHEVSDFRGTAEEGMGDSEVFQKAQGLGAILLTTDRDFFHTIPLLRQPNRAGILSRLEWLLGHVPESAFRNRAFQLRDKTWLAFPPVA